jgi:hypothetical protein
MNRNEPFYLVEISSTGFGAKWWIGEEGAYGKFTPHFHEIPDAYKFPTRWHALAVVEQYQKIYGLFEQPFEITEHAYMQSQPDGETEQLNQSVDNTDRK